MNKILTFILCVYGALSCALAQYDGHEYLITDHTPVITDSYKNELKKSYPELNVWAFSFDGKDIKKSDEFKQVLATLKKHGTSTEVIEELTKAITSKKLDTQVMMAQGAFRAKVPVRSTYVTEVPLNTMKKIPSKALGEIYSSFEKNIKLDRPMKLYFDNYDDFVAWTQFNNVDFNTWDSFVEHGGFGDVNITWNPYLWDIASDDIKDKYLQENFVHDYYGQNRALNRGKKVQIKITPQNLEKIASEYASKSYPKEKIIKTLKSKLGKNSEKLIDLISILPLYVQKQVNTLSLTDGPNCIATALCSAEGKDIEKGFVSNIGLEKKINQKFEVIDFNSSLQTGDMLVIYGSDGVAEHAFSYLGNDLCFSKNGATKASSYIIQKCGDVLALYSSDQDLRVGAYRKSTSAPGNAYGDKTRKYYLDTGNLSFENQFDYLKLSPDDLKLAVKNAQKISPREKWIIRRASEFYEKRGLISSADEFFKALRKEVDGKVILLGTQKARQGLFGRAIKCLSSKFKF